MKRVIAALAAVAVLATSGSAVLVWQLSRHPGPTHPEISAFTHGQLVRVGPYEYCNVYNPTECDTPQTMGELTVNTRDAVQLSVPPAISRAPWWLRLTYESYEQSVEEFKPGSTLAVTIPTVDPRYGKLIGFVVQLPTVVLVDGEEKPAVHAEWSVRTNWE